MTAGRAQVWAFKLRDARAYFGEVWYFDAGTGGSSLVKPNKFVGPLTGSADAGEGPGSGFCLKGAGAPGANYAELSASMTAKAASGK